VVQLLQQLADFEGLIAEYRRLVREHIVWSV
jgi:hypothetical protein